MRSMKWLSDRELPPDLFAAVMATGIVSVAAGAQDHARIDGGLAIIAAVVFMALLALVATQAARLLTHRSSVGQNLDDPDVTLRLLTFVAGCSVLGVRVVAHPAPLWALAGAAAASWVILVPFVVRGLWSRRHTELRSHAHGAWLLGCVSTAGLAITAADLSLHSRWPGWVWLSATAWIMATAIYLAFSWLIIGRALASPLVPDELTPDSWILMGALAICALAGDHLMTTIPRAHRAHWPAVAVAVVIMVLWVLASAWIPVLVTAEVWVARHHGIRWPLTRAWWSAVFPLGMYSVATHASVRVLQLPGLRAISSVSFWIALLLWSVVGLGWLLRVGRVVSGWSEGEAKALGGKR